MTHLVCSVDYQRLVSADSDVRPSLLFSHRLKVKHEALKKKSQSDPKPKTYFKEMENQLREEALNKPLDQSNKGFQMLTKMGFKGFAAKEATDETTSDSKRPMISEPIRIELKTDRKGLGTVVKKRLKTIHKDDDKVTEEKFLSHKRSRNQMILMEKDLRTAQKVCRNSDLESGVNEKMFYELDSRPKWFWPLIEPKKNEEGEDKNDEPEEEEEEEESVEVMFKTINDYLRDKYFYCIWCGIRFNDSQDLNDNCLGDTREDHND